MAEEALALSPVAVSAASPSDADYQAIRDVFMETERGRWFLAEYAKRNRNADTAMVLEAVSRIEQNMAAQAAAAASETLPDLARTALDQARAAIHREFSETGFDPVLLSWRKSARIIREIVWGLREVGADPRICNILDGQVRAIEAACDEFPLAGIRDRILAALDAVVPQDEIAAPAGAEDTADTDAVTDMVTDEAPEPANDLPPGEIEPEPAAAEAVTTETPVMEAAIVEAAPADAAIVDLPAKEASVTEATAIEAVEVTVADRALIEPDVTETEALAEAAALTAEPEPVAVSSEDAAILTENIAEDIVEAIAEPVSAPVAVAPETPPPAPAAAAPRSIMTASAAQPAPQLTAELAASKSPAEIGAVSLPETSPAEPAPEIAAPVAAADAGEPANNLWADIESEIAPLPPFDPAHEASLGASLIAQGVVKRPSKGRADLLAPIRRMSHAERIAFFS
ncbi:putative protein OS=Afipia felis OX=1035 GN=NCTC12722_01486 PE=4 SV=1 [Afipia felis]